VTLEGFGEVSVAIVLVVILLDSWTLEPVVYQLVTFVAAVVFTVATVVDITFVVDLT